MMTDLKILTASRELISKPENWTQKAYARGKSGRKVKVTSKLAVCFCPIGAIAKIAKLGTLEVLCGETAKALGQSHLVYFNDTHTHAEVLALFDAAIAAEREKAGAQ